MTRRERLMATLRGKPVDRPAVSFYELNGLDEAPDNGDPFNIFTHPSWQPLLRLAADHSDRIVLRGAAFSSVLPDPVEAISESESYLREGILFRVQRVKVKGRTLTSRTRRDPNVNTVWTEEHLLKSADDLRDFLEILEPLAVGTVDTDAVRKTEAALGESGIVMLDMPDPLCLAASLFSMEEYTVVALTEPALFHRLLETFAAFLWPRTDAVSQALPGRLWRIYGPEYASPPYLPPHLFREYVCRYVSPMIASIHRHSGTARIHAHGKLHAILDDIAGMGTDALDPIEPPPQGDVELSYVRERYGRSMVLFGNLEVSDIENLPTPQFAEKVRRALDEGTAGEGRGFVLMPSASPYGRVLAPLSLRNYETIIELVEA